MESLIPHIIWMDKQQSTRSDHLSSIFEFLETLREALHQLALLRSRSGNGILPPPSSSHNLWKSKERPKGLC